MDNFEAHDQNILKFIVDAISIDLQSYRSPESDLAFVREILTTNERSPTVFSALQAYKAEYAEILEDLTRSEYDRREDEAEAIETVAIAG